LLSLSLLLLLRIALLLRAHPFDDPEVFKRIIKAPFADACKAGAESGTVAGAAAGSAAAWRAGGGGLARLLKLLMWWDTHAPSPFPLFHTAQCPHRFHTLSPLYALTSPFLTSPS
jgi:hypothetical protein